VTQLTTTPPALRRNPSPASIKARELVDEVRAARCGTLPQAALAALRAKLLTHDDAARREADDDDTQDAAGGRRRVVSVRNEHAALAALERLAEAKLVEYPDPIEEDEAFLAAPRRADDWRHHVARTRLGEKRLWQGLADDARRARAALPPSR